MSSFRHDDIRLARLAEAQAHALASSMDSLGHAVSIWSTAGNELHRTPAMQELLDHPRDGARLTAECAALAHNLLGSLRPRPAKTPALTAGFEARIEKSRFRVSAVVHRMLGDQAPPLVLVSLVREVDPEPTGDLLQARYELTAAEVRVALLLSEGRTNKEIAQELRISPNTARRHTERVLAKIGVSSRARVAVALRQG